MPTGSRTAPSVRWKRSKHEIVLDQVEFLNPKPGDHQGAEVDTLA
jgi:hypothetical protein